MAFGAGLLLGPIGIMWVVPRLGTRTTELLEAPIMLLVTFVAPPWIVRRLTVSPALWQRLTIGGIGLGLMLVAELTLVSWLGGLSIKDYLATRGPVAGAVYYLLLILFALMPLLVGRTQAHLPAENRSHS